MGEKDYKQVRLLITEGANPHTQPSPKTNSRLLQALRKRDRGKNAAGAIQELAPVTNLMY